MNDSILKCITMFLRYRDFPGDFSPFENKRYFNLESREKVAVSNEQDLNEYLSSFFSNINFSKTGIMLSGGIDSALLASYCPKGTIAFTLSYPEMKGIDEVEQASRYADLFGLKLVVVPVTFQDVLDFQDDLMLHKQRPLSSIEIGIYKMSLAALDYGLENLLSGAGADGIFGGLFNIMSKVWTNESFIQRYSFLEPSKVLKETDDDLSVFEPYFGTNEFNTIGFMQDVFGASTISYFVNATSLAQINLLCPYEYIVPKFALDFRSMKSGNEKPILRSLFKKRAGEVFVPRKYPLPRPVAFWERFYGSLENGEFFSDAYLRCDTAEQKWIVYSADHFLTLFKDKCFNHYKRAYTTGVYDLFHIGHLKLLKRASSVCDELIVGVTTDELDSYKNKVPVIKFDDRIKIIRSLPFVGKAVMQSDMDKVMACKKYNINAVVVGSDWKNTDKWNTYEKDLKAIGVDVVYFPYTKRISSTKIVERLKND